MIATSRFNRMTAQINHAVGYIYIFIFRAIVDSIYFGLLCPSFTFGICCFLLLAFVLVCCQSSDTTVIEGVGVDLLSEFTVLSTSTTLTSLTSTTEPRDQQRVHHHCNHQNALEVITYY